MQLEDQGAVLKVAVKMTAAAVAVVVAVLAVVLAVSPTRDGGGRGASGGICACWTAASCAGSDFATRCVPCVLA